MFKEVKGIPPKFESYLNKILSMFEDVEKSKSVMPVFSPSKVTNEFGAPLFIAVRSNTVRFGFCRTLKVSIFVNRLTSSSPKLFSTTESLSNEDKPLPLVLISVSNGLFSISTFKSSELLFPRLKLTKAVFLIVTFCNSVRLEICSPIIKSSRLAQFSIVKLVIPDSHISNFSRFILSKIA